MSSNKNEKIRIFAYTTLGTIGLIFYMGVIASNTKIPEPSKVSKHVETQQEKAVRLRKLELCKNDLTCWGNKNLGKAIYYCQMELDRLPKYDHEWDSGYFNAEMFDSYKWQNKEKLIITYFGNGIKVQNGFGVWRHASYYCVYDTVNENVISAGMR